MTPCIEWWGTGDTHGYGVLYRNRKLIKAHRMVYVECFGPIPDDKPFILHHCDNRPCVNPEHLYAGTPQDNMNDKMSRGRGVFPGAPKREQCVHGHAFTPENTYIFTRHDGRTERKCRACNRRRQVKHRQQKFNRIEEGTK